MTTRYPRHQNRRRRYAFAPTASQAVAGAAAAGAAVLTAQAIYVGLKTPRLPPPDRSGHDFDPDGLVVEWQDEHQPNDDANDARTSKSERGDGSPGSNDDSSNTTTNTAKEEFRVVLLGDSPVEGIGNDEHHVALGGQTALSFSRMLRRPVRYWSYGKSGLTAGGIEEEMVPLLKRAAEKENATAPIDAVVICCGVNNVLWGHSAAAFGREVDSLLDSVVDCCSSGRGAKGGTAIILLGLLDFSHMPFLPWPLSSVAGWRSRALQKEMEEVVARRQQQLAGACESTTGGVTSVVIAPMPEVEHVLDGRSRHSLLNHLEHEVIPTLEIHDFFADDGFHPAKHGTAMLGNLLAQTYDDVIRL